MPYTATNFTVYPRQFWSGWTERTRINTDAFNASGGNTIIMRSEMIQGHYSAETGLKALVGSGDDENGGIKRRDIAAAYNNAFTFSDPGTLEHVKPKLYRAGGAQKTLQSWRSIMADTGIADEEILSFYLGDMYAKDAMVDYLQAALRSVIAAMSNTTVAGSNFISLTGGEMVSSIKLAQMLRKYGDAQQDIVAFAMNGLAFNDLVQDNINTYKELDSVAGAVLYGGAPATMNRRVIVTDVSTLTNPDGAGAGRDSYYIVGLTQGAVEVIESEERSQESEIVTGFENLLGRLQFETAYNVGVRGSSFSKAITNPDAAALALGTNWTQFSTSNKDLAGVVMEVDSLST